MSLKWSVRPRVRAFYSFGRSFSYSHLSSASSALPIYRSCSADGRGHRRREKGKIISGFVWNDNVILLLVRSSGGSKGLLTS